MVKDKYIKMPEDTLIVGIDDVHRSPCLASLVISGVQTTAKNIDKLRKLGVKDSKLLLPRKRFDLFPEILKLCDIKVCFLDAREISVSKNLNTLECEKYIEICKYFLNAGLYIIDNFEHDAQAFRKRAESIGFKPYKWSDYVVKHHADEDYTIVGAASCVSKVVSELELESLKHKIGYDFGSGNPSDARTLYLMYKCITDPNWKSKDFIIRKNWISWKRLQDKDNLDALKNKLDERGYLVNI